MRARQDAKTSGRGVTAALGHFRSKEKYKIDINLNV